MPLKTKQPKVDSYTVPMPSLWIGMGTFAVEKMI